MVDFAQGMAGRLLVEIVRVFGGRGWRQAGNPLTIAPTPSFIPGHHAPRGGHQAAEEPTSRFPLADCPSLPLMTIPMIWTAQPHVAQAPHLRHKP